MILDNDLHGIYDRSELPAGRPVVLEDDVWVAANAIILPGVSIGDGSVVAAGSVVRHDVPPFTVVAGNPARVVRSLDPEKFKRPGANSVGSLGNAR